MQGSSIEIIWVVVGVSLLMLFLGIAYVFVSAYSHKRILQAHRKQLEEVSKREKKYRDLFDNSIAGIVTFSLSNYVVIDANRAVLGMLGMETQDELQGVVRGLPQSTLESIRESLLHNRPVDNLELRVKRKDGEELWILFSAQLTSVDGVAQGVVVDITDRKRSEERVAEQNALLDQTQDAILVIDQGGSIRYWNWGAEQTYGWRSDEVLGCALVDLLYEKSNKQSFNSSFEDIGRFREWSGEQVHRTKDGKEILVESRWRTVHRNSTGHSVIMVVNSDITERRKLELISQRAQRTESMAVLTAGIAHDLQNIFAPVSVSIHLLRQRLRGKYNLSILKAVEEPIRSGIELVRNIMTYGKGIPGERVVVNLTSIIKRAVEETKNESRNGITFKEQYKGQEWKVIGDATQLKQVFLNLLANGRDAMSGKGVLSICASDAYLDEKILSSHPDVESGPYVLTTISDSGNGIPEQNLEKIFEPFFTTRESSGGTGLGLSVVHGIVKSHNGFVAVESTVGKGTTFRVYLPAVVEHQSKP